jgi:hypothetical protein
MQQWQQHALLAEPTGLEYSSRFRKHFTLLLMLLVDYLVYNGYLLTAASATGSLVPPSWVVAPNFNVVNSYCSPLCSCTACKLWLMHCCDSVIPL